MLPLYRLNRTLNTSITDAVNVVVGNHNDIVLVAIVRRGNGTDLEILDAVVVVADRDCASTGIEDEIVAAGGEVRDEVAEVGCRVPLEIIITRSTHGRCRCPSPPISVSVPALPNREIITRKATQRRSVGCTGDQVIAGTLVERTSFVLGERVGPGAKGITGRTDPLSESEIVSIALPFPSYWL